MAAVLVDVDLNDEKMNATRSAIIPQKNVPLKLKYPKPLFLRTKNGKSFLIIISHHEDEKKNCVGYDIAQEKYFKLGSYPAIQLKNPTLSISDDFQYLYCFDGTKLNRSFAVFEFDLNGDRPKIIDIKKSVPHKNIRCQRNIITCGKQTLSCYVPKPWDEFHIFGGRSNTKHLKWDIRIKKFITCSETHNIMQTQMNKQKLVATELLFCVKQTRFYMLAPNGTHEIWTLLYETTGKQTNEWEKSKLTLPYELFSGFGAIFYKKYMIIFGGFGGNGSNYIGDTSNYREEVDDIYIFDTVANEVQKSNVKCPKQGRFYAVYNGVSELVHLFDRNGFQHWIMDLSVIMMEIETVNKDIEGKEEVNGDVMVKDLNDCQHHFEVLYGYIVRLENEIGKLKENKCMNMGVMDDEKMNSNENGAISTVNELNQKIQELTKTNAIAKAITSGTRKK